MDHNALAAEIHAANDTWWRDPATGERIERNKGQLLMLVISEIAEAMEGERKDLMDDKLQHRRMAEVELADVLIRVYDFAGGFGYQLYDRSVSFAMNDRGEMLLRITARVVNAYWATVCENQSEVESDLSGIIGAVHGYARALGYDIAGAMEEKRAYNRMREDHKPAARLAAGGKKW